MDVFAKGPATSIVAGAFVLDDPLVKPTLARLPPLIRMTLDTEHAVPSFLQNIQAITCDVDPSWLLLRRRAQSGSRVRIREDFGEADP